MLHARLRPTSRSYVLNLAVFCAGLKALGTAVEAVPLTLTLECSGNGGIQPAVDDAAPVPPLEFQLLVEPSTAPTSLQLLLDGSPLCQARNMLLQQ